MVVNYTRIYYSFNNSVERKENKTNGNRFCKK